MNQLARSPEFLDILISIELQLVALGWIEISRQGDRRQIYVRNSRLINWAVACCEKSFSPELVDALAATRSPEKQWWILRQLLPDAAILTLASKLDLLMVSDQTVPPSYLSTTSKNHE